MQIALKINKILLETLLLSFTFRFLRPYLLQIQGYVLSINLLKIFPIFQEILNRSYLSLQIGVMGIFQRLHVFTNQKILTLED